MNLFRSFCSFCEQFKNEIFHGDVFKHLSIEEDKDLMNVMYVPLMVVQKQTPAAIYGNAADSCYIPFHIFRNKWSNYPYEELVTTE